VENSRVLYAYLRYENRREQSITSVLGSFLAQTLRLCEDEENKKILLEFYEQHYKKGTKPLIAELQDSIRLACEDPLHVFVVVDALDEYLDNVNYKTAYDFVQSLLALKDSIKVLVTSRNLGPIERAFDNHLASRLEIRPSEVDVQSYIRGRVKKDLPFARKYMDKIVEKVYHTAEAS
jgi:hypothetical protein